MRIIKILVWLNLIFFMLIPSFRYFFYNSMYKAPNDPYGVSDIIELLLGYCFIFVVLVSIAISLYLIVKKDLIIKKQCGLLIVFSIALVMLVSPLHNLAARLAI
jgi:hypothetical protein